MWPRVAFIPLGIFPGLLVSWRELRGEPAAHNSGGVNVSYPAARSPPFTIASAVSRTSVSVRPPHPNEFQLFQPIVGAATVIPTEAFPTPSELSSVVPTWAVIAVIATEEKPVWVEADPIDTRSMLGATDVGTAEEAAVSPRRMRVRPTGRAERHGGPLDPVCVRGPRRSCVIKPST